MIRKSSIFWILPLLLATTLGHADSESARYLRNGIHYYQTGRYQKAKGYFIAVLSSGTSREIKLAKLYLAKPPLKSVSRQKSAAPASPPPPVQRETEILEEPTPAYERPKESDEDHSIPFHLSGYLQEETAFRFYTPAQLSKLRTVGYLAGTGQFAEGISYKASGRLWYDGVFDLTHHYPRAVADDQKIEGMLRDNYVDVSRGDWDVRVGKQQIVWGEAVGLFYADVVNAKDLREFVLPDFEFIRIPEWGTDAEYTKGDFHAEALWLPWPEMDKVGRPGSEFTFPLPLPSNTPIAFGPAVKPKDSLENGEAGGRFSYRAEGWDLGVFHLRTWDKLPVYERTLSPGLATFSETHPRLTIDGATFAKEIDSVILKGEFVYYWQKNFQTTDLADPDGIKAKDYMDALLGADYTFADKLETTTQLGQRLIRDYESDLFQQRKRQTQLTVWLRRSFLDNHLKPELLVVKDLGNTDLMLRPKISYKFLEHWTGACGVDVFDGPAEGLFGEFSNRDRVYGELRFDF